MRKPLLLALLLTMVLALAVPAMAAAPADFTTGTIATIDKKGYDSFDGKEFTSNNSVAQFDNFKFVADNKTFNAWYIDVTNDILGTLDVAYKVGNAYYVVTFAIDGPGKYFIADSRGSTGANMVKIGTFNATPIHVHDYAKEVALPTCTEQGYTTYTCGCGDEYIDDHVPALGHDFAWEWGYYPIPCTVLKGVKQEVCQRPDCGAVGETAFGHPHQDDWIPFTVPPTCTEDGEYRVYCPICEVDPGFVNGHISAIGHDYVEVVTPPTCVDEGFSTYTCSRCGDEYTGDYVTATGHFYVTDAEVTFVNPIRILQSDGQYRWTGDLTINFTLNDSTTYERTWTNYIGVIIDPLSEIYDNIDWTICSWRFSTDDYDLCPGLDLCKDVAVYFTVEFKYVNGVPESTLSGVYFEVGDNWICGY